MHLAVALRSDAASASIGRVPVRRRIAKQASAPECAPRGRARSGACSPRPRRTLDSVCASPPWRRATAGHAALARHARRIDHPCTDRRVLMNRTVDVSGGHVRADQTHASERPRSLRASGTHRRRPAWHWPVPPDPMPPTNVRPGWSSNRAGSGVGRARTRRPGTIRRTRECRRRHRVPRSTARGRRRVKPSHR